MTIRIPTNFERQKSFQCPHCKIAAKYEFNGICTNSYSKLEIPDFFVKRCNHCEQYSIWHTTDLIFPISHGVQAPNTDLSPEIQALYNEAASIIQYSPRGASALMRLSLQLLCKDLGEKGENINEDIKSLVSKGLNPTIQKSLDLIRVVGNNAVHPGEINLDDNKEIAMQMFSLINLIAETMITIPRKIESTYETLIPDTIKEAINKRDNK